MSRQVWEPEHVVGAELARALVREQFGIAAEEIACVGQGFDNTAYLVDGAYIVRFPRRSVAAELIATERALTPVIAPALPVRIPVARFAGVPSLGYPWPFVGYDVLAGETACGFELANDERAALAAALGAFLRALHGIDPAQAIAGGLPGDTIGRLDHARRLPLATERYRELETLGLIVDGAELLEFLAAHPPQPPQRSRIVHGDLYARHLLLDGERRLCGVIDWGDAHAGDPALDLAIAATMLSERERPAFFTAYGAIDDATWRRALYRGVYHAALVAHYGAHAPDAAMLRSGLAGIAFAREAVRQLTA